MDTITAPKPFVFVLMPFDPEFDDLYKLGIKAAAEQAGYYCERLDEQIFDEAMLPRIYNQISKADIVVADMTGRNANVFYEVGYSHALNKRTVLLTKTTDDIPFDLKHHFHIVHEGRIIDLKSKLAERLSYYRSNPEVTSIDPFSEVSININGCQINISSDEIQTVIAESIEDSEGTVSLWHVVPLDVTFHLKINSPKESLSFEVLLITSNQFTSCYKEYEDGRIYTNESINDGHSRMIHKPLTDLGGSRGSWSQIPFHLRCRKKPSDLTPLEMTLRLMCEGLVRDIKLQVSLITI